MGHYDDLRAHGRATATLASVARLLAWDQETYMPSGAAPARADQMGAMATLVHERKTSPRLGELIEACEQDRSLAGDPASETAAEVREFRRDYDLATKLPGDLVAELARVGSQAQEAWKKARADSDFAQFRPWLEKMVALTRRKAECYGVPEGGELYDALLNEYEPGATAAEIEAIFTPLGERLSALVAELTTNGTHPSEAPLELDIPADRQHEFGQFVLRAMCFDLGQGRLDVVTHPFCEGIAPGDTRLTTRYREERFTDALYGTMHEGGHGIYEQNLPRGNFEDVADHYGSPLGESISLGIHESQSRMWENFVGRSLAFWEWALPHAQKILGSGLERFRPEDLYRAVNTGKPSYIRVEADEATYNLHVMLRFGLERALVRGDLSVADLPGAWNERFESLLGIAVPDDRRGCLQDVHWSFGLVGYFPTYTLGNLYAAQLWETIQEEIPDLEGEMRKGDFGGLKLWLASNIHHHGRRYRAGELCERLTGRALGADPLMRHLEGKLRPIYGTG